MKPLYAAPGPDTLACPACDTRFLGATDLPLYIRGAQLVEMLQLGDQTIRLDGQLRLKLDQLLAAGDYDVEDTAVLQLSGRVECPACGHHSDWQLQRPEADLMYSRYHVQALEPETAPATQQQLEVLQLMAVRDLQAQLRKDEAPKDLSNQPDLEALFAYLAQYSLARLAYAPAPLAGVRYYAVSLAGRPDSD
ncbi:MAG: hypothetical protein ACK51A_00090 [Sphingobacteriia bacterium]